MPSMYNTGYAVEILNLIYGMPRILNLKVKIPNSNTKFELESLPY